MATAKEIFYNSYFKRLKRPEFQANRSGSTNEAFNPDNVYGANSVSRSESVNPWAGRNASNAKFGFLGGNNQGGGDQGLNQSEGLTVMNSILNKNAAQPSMPSMPSTGPQEPSALGVMATPIVGYGGELLGKSIADWINGPEKFSDLSPMMQGYAEGVLDKGGVLPPDSGTGMGGYDKLFGKLMEPGEETLASEMLPIAETGVEAGTDVLGSLPYVGAGLKTVGDVMSGKMLRRPAESLGGTAGMLGGAAAGTAIFPGVGTVLGGLLGGSGGGLLGRWFGRMFR